MPRRAEWRQLPDEPKGGVRLLYQATSDALTLPHVQVVTAILHIAPAFPLLLFSLFRFQTASFFFILTFAVVNATFLIVRLLTRKRRRSHPLERPPSPLPRNLEALLPRPLPENTFPVRLDVRYRGALTGIDMAAATFVDGWLHVEGVRASFALHACEGRAEWRSGTLRIEFLDDQSVDLWIVGGLSLEEHYRHAANLWISDKEHPEGKSILPPLAPQPMLQKATTIMTIVGFVGVIVGILAHWLPLGHLTTIIAVLSGLAALAFGCGLSAHVRQDAAGRQQAILPTFSHLDG